MRSVQRTDLRLGLTIGLVALIALAGCARGTGLPATDAKGATPDAEISVTALPPALPSALPSDATPDPAAAPANAQKGGGAGAQSGEQTPAPGKTDNTAKVAATPSFAPQSAPPERPPLPVPTTVFGRKVQQDLQNACTRTGGIFGPRGKSGALACFITPPDAGKACTRKSDCTGQCLARSRTCSPVIPLVGCNEVLLESGARVTECVE